MRRDLKSLDTHRASDREDESLPEQKANTANRGKLYGVPVMASQWRERNQKPHPKTVRQGVLVKRYRELNLQEEPQL